MSRTRTAALVGAGVLLLAGSLLVAVRIGASGLGYAEIGRVIGTRVGLPVTPLPRLTDSVIWDLRIPRVLLAALVGAVLAVCGAALRPRALASTSAGPGSSCWWRRRC